MRSICIESVGDGDLQMEEERHKEKLEWISDFCMEQLYAMGSLIV